MQTSDSIVIIPTYNERENIENIIRAVFALEHDFHILVVEDNSPDGTADIVRHLQQEFPERLFMLERQGKQGLGTAYIAGFKWALEHTYDYIFEMDADFSHNPKDLPRLYDACAKEGADVSIGVALHRRSERGELAHGTGAHVLLRLKVRPPHHRPAHTRHHGGLRLLPPPGVADHTPRPHPLQGLRLPR